MKVTNFFKRMFLVATVACCAGTIFAQQDVIYTVKAVHNETVVRLDSILIENLTGTNSLVFRDLPDADEYVINLTQGILQGGTGIAGIESGSAQTFSLVQNSAGTLVLNYNGKEAQTAAVRVYNAVGQLLYAPRTVVQPQTSLSITLPDNGIYFVSVQTHSGSATFKAIGNNSVAGFNLTTGNGLRAVVQANETAKPQRVSLARADEEPAEAALFSVGDELMIFGFRNDYVITPASLYFDADTTIVLESQTFDEVYTPVTVNIEIPTDTEVDLSGYKLVSADFSVPVAATQSNEQTVAVEIPVSNESGVQLIMLKNQEGAVIQSGLIVIDDESTPENSPNGVMSASRSVPNSAFLLNAETTALAELMLHPWFASTSPEVSSLLKQQLKSLPTFPAYKEKVLQLTSAALLTTNAVVEDVDYTAPIEYQKVILDFIDTYALDQNLMQNFVTVDFTGGKDASGNVEFKVKNTGKRTIHIYANRQYKNENGVFYQAPEMIKNLYEYGDDFELFDFIRLRSGKCDYWTTVVGGFKAYVDMYFGNDYDTDYIFNSETNYIKAYLGDANTIEVEVWGLGNTHKPFSEYSSDEKMRLVLAVLDGVYTDVVSPYVELFTGIKEIKPAGGNYTRTWDFRFGKRNHPLQELLKKLGTAFVTNPSNLTKLTDNIIDKNYGTITKDVGAFIWSELESDLDKPANEQKYLNLIYNTFKNILGVSKTSDAFRALFKNGYAQMFKKYNLITATMGFGETSVDLIGAVYFTATSEAKSTFTHSYGGTSTTDDGVLINGIVWATRNVDAPGTFAATPESPGMFYQWNRKVGWSATDPLVNSDGGTTWNSSTPNGTEWEKVNDPCPSGWRVPTHDEQVSLLNSGSSWTTQNGVTGRVFGSGSNTLFLPAAGYRHYSVGTLLSAGAHGDDWSSTQLDGSYAYSLGFGSGYAGWDYDVRSYGFSVRCVQE
jgi:uncharacterized protein (TIGR02145 family)